MKKRTVFLVLACLVAGSCVTSLSERIWLKEPYSEEYIKSTAKPIAQQTLTVPKMTYDQVWDICERTLIRLGFGFYKADKTDGEMRVGGMAKTDELASSTTQTASWSKANKLSVLISKTDGQISVQVGCLWVFMEDRGVTSAIREPQPAEKTLADREVTRIIRQLKKKLIQ
jgi:hypothetical protein